MPQIYKYRIIVAGGRDFDDWNLLRDKLSYYLLLLEWPKDIEIVSGGAEWADKMAEQYASKYGYALRIIDANWDKYGKQAGPLRNKAMAAYATHLIAFWDGKSSGTRNMIEEANAAGLKIRIVKY